jgi:hypothetical protein
LDLLDGQGFCIVRHDAERIHRRGRQFIATRTIRLQLGGAEALATTVFRMRWGRGLGLLFAAVPTVRAATFGGDGLEWLRLRGAHERTSQNLANHRQCEQEMDHWAFEERDVWVQF